MIQLQKVFKIEVSVTPNYNDNKYKPYHWVLLGYNSEWCNECFGWAESPTKAWEEAYTFYITFKDS